MRPVGAHWSYCSSRDLIAKLHLSGCDPASRELTAFRIDRDLKRSAQKLALDPAERREVDMERDFSFQVFCPGDSVSLVVLRGK